MDRLRSEVVRNMRSCLNSSKDAVCSALSVRQLNDDYKCLIGESIPFQKLGFKKLEDLIQSQPNEFSLTKKGNEWLVRATVSDKTAHITDMVLKQKVSRRKRPTVPSFYTSSPRLQPGSKWRPPRSQIANRYRGSKTSQKFGNDHFVHRGPTVIYRGSTGEVVTPEQSNYQSQPQQMITAPPKNPSYSSRPKEVNAPTAAVKTVDLRCKLNKTKILKKMDTLDNNNSLCGYASTSSSGKSNIRESGNSSSKTSNVPPFPHQLQEFVRTKDPLADLKNFAEIYKLGEVVVTIAPFKQKKKNIYSCKIKVGSKYTYSSYPKDFFNPLEAQNFCCEEAFKDLIPKCKQKCLMVASEKDILERIPPMVEKHLHGIWASQLELIYSEKYNELLSDDWLKIIDISPSVQIEKVSNKYILYYCRPGNELQKVQLRTTDAVVSKVSVPANMIQLGKEGQLIAEVIYVVSAAEIWCQQVGTEESENFKSMMDRLQVYYEEHERQLIPANICNGGYYVAKVERNYSRVTAIEVNENEVNCFFIDLGIECSCPIPDIFKLKEEYAATQAQAFVCRLYDLEELYEVSVDSQSVFDLLDKVVLVEIAVDAGSNNHINEALPVYMYDFNTGQLINEDLISRLTLEMASPILSEDSITQVHISNIEANGDIYVQVRSPGYTNFLKLKQELEKQVNLNPPRETLHQVNKLNSKGKLYFFKQSVDHWSRIQLIDWSPDGMYAQIYFVDEGNSRVIKVADEELYSLEALDDKLNNYPHQAVKVRMDLEQIPPDFVDLVSEIVPKDIPVMLKIVKTVEDIKMVKLFGRIGQGGLFCINTSLSLNYEVKKKENSKLQNRLKHLQLSDRVSSAGVLKSPRLPEIGKEFPVFVSFVVNPHNFYIQLIEPQLTPMMHRLQERYKDVYDGNLKVEEILIGSTYASKYEDGIWYRTIVKKVVHSGFVSVFYCDYGYYQTINVKQLVPLEEEFMDLPYQGLKAKLTGIKPIQSKWTMADCERFTELINRKPFFAFLKNIGKDDLCENDLVLEIKLIDKESNYNIHDELVKWGIAAKDDK